MRVQLTVCVEGEEVLHLPVIVEAAESSPAAAREAAHGIRKFLSKNNSQRAYVQYNAIMLVRILADNPGKNFTKNIDAKFITTVKELLKEGRDMSVQQILRESLDSFETQKKDDENLRPLREMWTKYKQKTEKQGGNMRAPPSRIMSAPPFSGCAGFDPHQAQVRQQENYFARNHHIRGLPPPQELAGRIEEARTSTKILLQVVQSTPPNEFVGNELIKEFVDRCQSASRSIQGYIHSDNPAPDEDTLMTLIETSDQISLALSRHQRAMLQARKAAGSSPGSTPDVAPPPGPPPGLLNGSSGHAASPSPAPAPGLFSSPNKASKQREIAENLAQAQEPQAQDNPFSDQHATAAVPQDYGMPPSSIQHVEPSSHAGSSYPSIPSHHRNVSELESPVSPEVRRPVQYRF